MLALRLTRSIFASLCLCFALNIPTALAQSSQDQQVYASAQAEGKPLREALKAPVLLSVKAENTPVLPAPKAPKSLNWTPTWRESPSLKIDDVASLQKLSLWHLQALSALHKLQRKQEQLYDYQFADVNGDGQTELVSLSLNTQNPQRYTHKLRIHSFDPKQGLSLRFEHRHSHSQALPFLQKLSGRSQGFQLCESWQLDDQKMKECSEIFLDRQWQAKVLRHESEQHDISRHDIQRQRFDFVRQEASRSYLRLPSGPVMPALQQKTDFNFRFALPEDKHIDTKQAVKIANPQSPNANPSTFLSHSIVATQTNSTDVPIHWQASYDDEALNLQITIPDDSPQQTDHCRDDADLQLDDHLAFWFDLKEKLQRDQAQEDWELSYQLAYQSSPFRHDFDVAILAFAITASGCFFPLSALSKKHKPTFQVQRRELQYQVKVRIPAAALGKDKISKLDKPQGLGFTLLQHNVGQLDEAEIESKASSQWRWADPYSFGQLFFLPKGAEEIPNYPLLWEQWLH